MLIAILAVIESAIFHGGDKSFDNVVGYLSEQSQEIVLIEAMERNFKVIKWKSEMKIIKRVRLNDPF